MLHRTMLFIVLAALVRPAHAQEAPPNWKMTYAEAKARLPKPEPPPFWIGDIQDLRARLARLKRGDVRTIAISPGGRPIDRVAYGDKEAVERNANYNSAVGGRDATAYLDKAARRKPVLLFVGPVHGHELEGLAGLMSLIETMETGRDLRGKEQPELRRLGDRCRLVIVPMGNPDGMARFEPRAIHGMPMDEFQFWAMGTWSDDRIARWPDSKRRHPRTGPTIGFMGCYFDDAGVNPMHDEFFAPMSTEAPALLRLAADEGPDLTVSLHSHAWNPAVLRPAYAPLAVEEEIARLAERYYALLESRGLPHDAKPFTPGGESKGPIPAFNLVSALHHVSGAPTFTLECPHGCVGPRCCQATFEQILDIQLSLYEAMMAHVLDGKAQP